MFFYQDTCQQLNRQNNSIIEQTKQYDLFESSTPSLQLVFSFMGVDLRHCRVVYSSIAESLFIPMGL